MGMQFSEDDGHVCDVVAVSLDGNSILWVDEKKTLSNAEAVVAMAVMRQGVEDRLGGLVFSFLFSAGFGRGYGAMTHNSKTDVPALHALLAQAEWKEQRIKDLAAAIHGYVATRGAQPLMVEGDDLDLVGEWINDLKNLWESM